MENPQWRGWAINPKIVQNLVTIFFKSLFWEGSAYFEGVSACLREVSVYFREYFREVSVYFREVTSFQNLETSFEKFGAIMATGGLQSIILSYMPIARLDVWQHRRTTKPRGFLTYSFLVGSVPVLRPRRPATE